MKSSLVISLAVHLVVAVIAVEWVSFRQVDFVPRQVYAVDLVTSAESEKPRGPRPTEETSTVPPEPREKPEPVAPPVRPKPRPKPKKQPKPKPKTIPTTQIEKTAPDNAPVEPDLPEQPTAQTGDIAFDTDDFPFAPYIARMRRKIASQWRVPSGSQGQNRTCRVYFRVLRGGGVTGTVVEESSGLFLFDQAAQRAVLQASPMPPLPPEYTDAYLGVHFSFAYKER